MEVSRLCQRICASDLRGPGLDDVAEEAAEQIGSEKTEIGNCSRASGGGCNPGVAVGIWSGRFDLLPMTEKGHTRPVAEAAPNV